MRTYDSLPPNTVARKQTPRHLAAEDVHSLIKLGFVIWIALFVAAAAFLTTWDQLAKTRGMTFAGLLKGSVCCSSLLLLAIMAGVPVAIWLLDRYRGDGLLRGAMFELEEITNVDVNRDGVVGTNVLVQTDEHQWRLGQYNVPPELLFEWARAALEGRSLAFSRWEKEWPDGRHGYTKFREQLVGQRRLVQKTNGQITLTAEGRQFFEQIANLDERNISPPHSGGYPQIAAHTPTHKRT